MTVHVCMHTYVHVYGCIHIHVREKEKIEGGMERGREGGDGEWEREKERGEGAREHISLHTWSTLNTVTAAPVASLIPHHFAR